MAPLSAHATAARWTRRTANGFDVPDAIPGGNTMAFKNPKFLIVAGHRNLDGGGSSHEKERTPALARTHRDALKAAGFEVHYLQEEDGDGDPNFTNGDLDVVGNLARDIMAAKQGNWVMIDCHYAGDGGPKGHLLDLPEE